MSEKNRWVLLENSEAHTVLLNHDEAINLISKLRLENFIGDNKCTYETFYDEYYEYIDYYSEEEKEQINRLIP
jgi:hypothetical protein